MHLGISSPVFMNRGGIAFFDLGNSRVTITAKTKGNAKNK